MTLDAADPVDEYMGDDGDEAIVQSVKLSGSAASGFDDNIYVMMDDGKGTAKFFTMKPQDSEFDVDVWAGREDKGLFNVSYFTVQDGKLKISPETQVAYVPKFANGTEPSVSYSRSNVYAHVGDEVPAGLIVEADDTKYDISAPALGAALYEVSDSSVAEVTSDGKIRALKEGRATITASAYGKTATINVVVKGSASEADTTKDILADSDSGDSDDNNKSSSGGCEAGFTAFALLSIIGLTLKRR